MFSIRTDLLAWATSQSSTQNKACTPTHNEQFLGVNSPVENVHGLELIKRLVLCFFIILIILLLHFHITVLYMFSLVL